jgi:hypothetical protein
MPSLAVPVLSLAVLLPASKLPSESHSLKITTWTDALSPVPNNKVKVVQGTQSRVYLTDAQAATPEFSITAGSPLTIHLRQKSIPAGIAVGQTYSHSFADGGTGGEVINMLTLLQPVLEPVVLDSSATRFVQAQHHDRWSFYHFEGASFAFPANVGLLMTPREIDAFEAYYGVQFAHDDYRMGLVVEVAEAEPVGDPGLALELRFDSYGFDEIPGVDRYFVARSAADMGVADFAVGPESWEDSGPEVAGYSLTGTLGKGMNLLLFREGGGAALDELLAAPPTFGPATVPSGSNPATTDCDPQPPLPSGSETCALTPPSDDPGCAPTGCTGVTPEDCTVTYIRGGETVCGGAAGGPPLNKTYTITTTVKGGVTVSVNVGVGSGEASGGVDNSETESVTFGVGPGAHGCGQCAQLWKKVIKCSKTCTVHKKKFAWLLLSWYCADVTETATCISTSGTSATYCDRTGC